jgi:hypothetical protein
MYKFGEIFMFLMLENEEEKKMSFNYATLFLAFDTLQAFLTFSRVVLT